MPQLMDQSPHSTKGDEDATHLLSQLPLQLKHEDISKVQPIRYSHSDLAPETGMQSSRDSADSILVRVVVAHRESSEGRWSSHAL